MFFFQVWPCFNQLSVLKSVENDLSQNKLCGYIRFSCFVNSKTLIRPVCTRLGYLGLAFADIHIFPCREFRLCFNLYDWIRVITIKLASNIFWRSYCRNRETGFISHNQHKKFIYFFVSNMFFGDVVVLWNAKQSNGVRSSYHLPCQVARKLAKRTLFAYNLVRNRWSSEFYPSLHCGYRFLKNKSLLRWRL